MYAFSFSMTLIGFFLAIFFLILWIQLEYNRWPWIVVFIPLYILLIIMLITTIIGTFFGIRRHLESVGGGTLIGKIISSQVNTV